MIRDLENMILTISDSDSKAYVREALQCYNAGAYRAAVVLSLAAGMDGLRRRLTDLANSGGISADIVAAHTNIDRAFNNQDSFEKTLIDASEKTVSFLTVSEAKKLRALFDVRNLCAHPSGHRGTAEEARDAMTTVIDFILSRPALMGMTGITTLLDRLKGPSFFPNINAWEKNLATSKKEIELLKPSLYRALIQKIVARLVELAVERAASPSTAGVGKEERWNLTIFLSSATKVSPELRLATWHYLGRIIEHRDTTQEASIILSQDAEGISLADTLVRDRAIALVRRNLKNSFARRAIRNMRSLLTEEELGEIAAAFRTNFLSVDVAFNTRFESATEIALPGLIRDVFAKLVEDCADYTFDVANPAIITVQQLQEVKAISMPTDLQVDYVLTIASNSSRFHSATEAKKIAEEGLGSRRNYLDAVASSLGSDGAAFLDKSTNWEYLVRVCLASKRVDIVLEIVRLFREAPNRSSDSRKMLLYLKNVDNTQVAQAAKDVIALVKLPVDGFDNELA